MVGTLVPSITGSAVEPIARERSSFLYSFSLLPRDERDAMHRIYEFCRFTDDLVDEDLVVPEYEAELRKPLAITPIPISEKKRLRLKWWRTEVERCYEGKSTHPILKNLHKVLVRFKIPKQYLLTLIDGVEMDLIKTRYETFDELKEYCYAVASVIGLICIEVFGYKHEETREYAVNLGYALQLTNILRDIKQDAAKGRIYLPLEDLRRFGYSEQDLLAGNYNWQFIELMKFETARAREYYSAARSQLRKDEHFTMFAAEIMDAIYFRLLRKIELSEFAVFERRIKVSTPHKLLIVARFWINRFF
jgi:phytoene synthase